MSNLLKYVALTAAMSAAIGNTNAAEVSSTNLTLTPAYNASGCALVTSNGYGGTDRQLFIPAQDGYFWIKDFSSSSLIWIVTPEAFDPNQRLVDQALATNYGAVESPRQIYLTAGTRVLVWAAYTGGWGTVAGCQGDGATSTVTMRIVGEDSGIPDPPTALAATLLNEGGGASIAFTAGAGNGSAITNYQYGTYDDEEGEWAYTALTPADAASPIAVTGFANGAAVTVRLKAVNANGASTDSAAVTFTPAATAAPAEVRPVPAMPSWALLLLTTLLALAGLTRRRA